MDLLGLLGSAQHETNKARVSTQHMALLEGGSAWDVTPSRDCWGVTSHAPPPSRNLLGSAQHQAQKARVSTLQWHSLIKNRAALVFLGDCFETTLSVVD